MPSSQGHVTTEDGVRLFFEAIGDGPQAVVVPNGFHLIDAFKRLLTGRTLIFYDLRNRGYSDTVVDPAKLARGIHNDVDDLDAIRRHFGIGQVDAIGHSYAGLMVMLYAMKYPAHVDRLALIGPAQPNASKQYPVHLTGADATMTDVFAKLAELQRQRASYEPVEFCKKVWELLRVIYVTNPDDAGKINWGRCDLPNELNLMKYWMELILPSISSLDISADEFARVRSPVLAIHGTRDRSAPYGGGREWALTLPNARLVTVENAGHAPWVEDSELVFSSMETFLGGAWPVAARKVESIDPGSPC
jgi:proline iminopeptidase